MINISIDDVKERLSPQEALSFIGYHKSSPEVTPEGIRDYCPIHESDNQKSLCIDSSKKVFNCHKCDAKGDLVDLYMQAKGLTLPQALEDLASKYNITSNTRDPMTQTLSQSLEEKTKKPIVEIESVWNRASEEGDHPYLEEKKIQGVPGIRFGDNEQGYHSIIVPLSDIDGKLKTVQYITSKTQHSDIKHQRKLFHRGCCSTSGFFTLGNINDSEEIYVAEGLATAFTAWSALEKKVAVVSVGSVGNLSSVAVLLHKKYPKKRIILALDLGDRPKKQLDKLEFDFSWCEPNFEGLSNGEDKPGDDFNDLVSKYNQPLSFVKEQLKKQVKKESEPFESRLGKILDDLPFAKCLSERSYDSFIQDHKRLYSSGGLITGFDKLDEQVYFSKGDLVTVQSMSNHGKSTLMLQLAYQFLTEPSNDSKDPLCIFITYESAPLRIEEKLLNMMSNLNNEGTILQYQSKSEEKYLYPNKWNHKNTIMGFDQLLTNRRIGLLKRTPLENLSSLVTLYKQEFPERAIVLFLDYVQIIDNSLRSDGWEKIKEIAYFLEALAIEQEIIIFGASQVNDKRQVAEGRGLYNASTTVFDIANHSHTSLKMNEEGKKLYKEQVNGKDVCSLSVIKQKHGASFCLDDYLLFNGYCFTEKAKEGDCSPSKLIQSEKKRLINGLR